jgi:hypothetical protein
MKGRNRVIAAVLCLCAAPAAAAAADNPFLGTWAVTDAKIAPWYDGNGAKPKIDPALARKTILFARSSASGSSVVGCSKPIYAVTTVGPEMLFEGNLKDPAKDAATLGFKSDKIVTMNEGCDVKTGDMALDFPMVDQDTILLGLNNMIYTLKRVPAD